MALKHVKTVVSHANIVFSMFICINFFSFIFTFTYIFFFALHLTVARTKLNKGTMLCVWTYIREYKSRRAVQYKDKNLYKKID